jgi:polysaccharide export outer membrane protein
MNKSILHLLLVGFIVTSCVPTKDLIYLQDKDNTQVNEVVNQVVSKPYRLQTNDVISITIKALDQKLVAMFSPSESSLNTKSDIWIVL